MFKKLNIFLLILLLIFSFIPTQDLTTFAEMKQIDDSNNEHIKVVLFSEQKDSDIFLYADIKGEEIITTIPDGTEVTLIDLETENEELALIRYEIINDKNKVEKFEGYVHIGSIFSLEEAEVFRENRSQVLDESELEKNDKSINELEKESIVEKSELKEDKEEDEKPKQEKSTDISNRSVLKPSSENNRTMAINVVNVKEESTSLLGHIRNRNVKIYQDLTNLNQSVVSGEEYTNRVYFIKKRAIVNGQTYYFLSTRSDPSLGPVGWVKAEDMAVKNHVGVDKEAKTFYVKGTNYSYDTAWGGAKNRVHDLTQYKDHVFEVHLTEKAGNTTWYRGVLGGKTVWIEEQYLTTAEEKSTSLLGHIRSRNVKISEKLGDFTNAFTAGAEYTNQVYYIKKEAVINGQKYYLLSTRASSTIGVVGWAKAEDIAVKTHIGVDKEIKYFVILGSGHAYDKVWGGSKNLVYNLSSYNSKVFEVHLTEKAGNTTWYRGILDGKTVWIESKYLKAVPVNPVSFLGHIRNRNVKITEKLGDFVNQFSAGAEYTNRVYYIKKEAILNEQKYYLLSTRASSTIGLIGWAKAEDIAVKQHTTIDKTIKYFLINGYGSAYDTAWGGKKNIVYEDLSDYKDQIFIVHLTERAGNDVWYRGVLNGDTVWIESKNVRPAKKVIVIDPGHGGSDPGAVANGLKEKEINLDIAITVKKILEDKGFTVVMTRNADQYVSLPERSSLANDIKADLFVSIHTNAGGGTGIETLWYSKGPEPQKSRILAEKIQEEVIKQTNVKNRGVKKDKNLHVNRETFMPSALIEVGFIDNNTDVAKLRSSRYRQQVAIGIANGIIKYFKIYP